METKGLINQAWEVEHEVNGNGELQPLSVRTARTHRLICDFEYSANSIEQDEEHAKLIASAPDMLSLLKDISFQHIEGEQMLIAVEQLIKKATE